MQKKAKTTKTPPAPNAGVVALKLAVEDLARRVEALEAAQTPSNVVPIQDSVGPAITPVQAPPWRPWHRTPSTSESNT
jgi:hypothetical protein